MIINVQSDTEGQRLDLFLTSYLKMSRQKVKQLIDSGCVSIVKQRCKASYVVQVGDCIHVMLPDDTSNPVAPVVYDPFFLYEDQDILVLNKPVGLVVHSDQPNVYSLVTLLQDHGVGLAAVDHERPGIVHRLDKMTEGLMVIAKTIAAFDVLKQQFQQREVVKYYYAVVKGNMVDDFLRIQQPIARHPSKRHLFRVHTNGKDAVSEVEVLKRFNTKTLCRVGIKTGRTHQIRVHLSSIGYPVLQDPDYGENRGGAGQLLQACLLQFKHPIFHQKMSFELSLSNRLK